MKQYLQKFDPRSAQQIVLAKRREKHLQEVARAEQVIKNAFGKVVEYEFINDVEENATLPYAQHSYEFRIAGIQGLFSARTDYGYGGRNPTLYTRRDYSGMYTASTVGSRWYEVTNVSELEFSTETRMLTNGE